MNGHARHDPGFATPMPRGKRAGSKMPTADYDAGCRVRSTSTKCPTRKSRTSSLPPISRPENAWASRLLFRQSSKSLAKTCKSGSHKALLHLALESRTGLDKLMRGFDGRPTLKLTRAFHFFGSPPPEHALY